MYPRWTSVRISFTRSRSPTSAPCCPCANKPSTAGFKTRTNVPCGVTPVTMPSKTSPIRLLIATAAIRFDISRSTFRAASSCNVQFSAIAASSSFEYVQTNKSDYIDAEAIAEAVQRPRMRFVPIKTEEQLDLQALHRVRERWVMRAKHNEWQHRRPT